MNTHIYKYIIHCHFFGYFLIFLQFCIQAVKISNEWTVSNVQHLFIE